MDRIFNSLAKFTIAGQSKAEMRLTWLEWKRAFELCLEAAKTWIKDSKTRKTWLLAHGGIELQKIFFNIPGADVKNDKANGIDCYKVAIQKLDEYFAPTRHEVHERYLFWKLKPEPDETLHKFAMRAETMAKLCKFGNTEEKSREVAVIDKVLTVAPKKLRDQLLDKKDLTLERVIRSINTYEMSSNADEEMSAQAAFKSFTKGPENVQRIEPVQSLCPACNYSHGNRQVCPAYGKTCGKCGGRNHFRAACRTPMNWQPQSKTATAKRSSSQAFGASSSSGGVLKRVKSQPSRKVFSLAQEKEEPIDMIGSYEPSDQIVASVAKVKITMQIDSGAQSNIIDDYTWEYMKARGIEISKLTPADKKFRAYAAEENLKCLGMFEAEISIQDKDNCLRDMARFYVIQGGPQPLLGKITAVKLGVLKVGLPSQQNIQNVTQMEGCNQFPAIKGIQVKLTLDDSIKPVAQPLRRVPIPLMGKVEEKLDELLAAGIIEPVHGAPDWVSPIVVIIKDNGEIRLCLDMRMVNQAIKREYYPLPTIEDVRMRLRGAKYFSRLDLKDAFHQLLLHPDSRPITTFITHRGLFQYTRLMFGISSAPEIFQKKLSQIISKCPNSLNWIDDVICWGETIKRHDEALKDLLNTLESYGIVLNHMKTKFRLTSIDFLGHTFDETGFRPSHDKIKAILELTAPKNAEELRSFLGTVGYIGEFIEGLSTLTDPLRVLLKKGQKFEWSTERDEIFTKIKVKVAEITSLTHFDPKLKTKLVVDASPVGVGAVLVQFHDGVPKAVAFASRSLSDTEKRYHQSEKEALACVYGCERFADYLLGLDFELETDHKALETLFSSRSKPCLRIERWVLRLQAFRYKIVYRQGLSNIADTFSRMLPEKLEADYDPDCETFIRSIAQLTAIDVPEVEKYTDQDSELLELRECLEKGDWNFTSENLKVYKPFKDEFGSVGKLIIRRDRIVIPGKLRDRMLELAHEGHPGQTIMASRLRYICWWPGMDNEVKSFVKRCEGCTLVSRADPPEPMQRKKLPIAAWIDLAIDFLGPLPSQENLLVVVDYYSRWIEIKIMRSITSERVIEVLEEIFTRNGYPRSITLDNGKQFVSREFENYCAAQKIQLNKTTPYFPQENGEVERQNRSLMKRIKISHTLSRDWKKDLRDYLQMYYTTPHTTTGKTPADLMKNREMRSRLPSLKHYLEPLPSADFIDRDIEKKEKGKEVEDKRRGAKVNELAVGDEVFIKNQCPSKVQTRFQPSEATVIDRSGSRAEVVEKSSGKQYTRHVTHLKKVPTSSHESNKTTTTGNVNITENQQSPSNDTKGNHSVPERPKRSVKPPNRFGDHVVYQLES